MEISVIPISQIDPNPSQPRQRFTAIDEMAASIQEHGVLTPLLARPIDDRFQLIDGERRYRAALQLSMDNLPVSIHAVADETAYVLGVVENLQREGLTPLEEADAYTALQKFGMTQQRIAETISRDQSYVAHKIALRRLPQPLLAFLDAGDLTETHLRILAKLEDLVGGEVPATYRIPNLTTRGPGRIVGPSAHFFQQGPRPIDLLSGIAPVGEEDVQGTWSALHGYGIRSPFSPMNERVEQVSGQMLEYVARHTARPLWGDLAFYFAALAVQKDFSTRALDTRLNAWQKEAEAEQRQWAWERAAERNERLQGAPASPAGKDRLRAARKVIATLPAAEQDQAGALLAPRRVGRSALSSYAPPEKLSQKAALGVAKRLTALPDAQRQQLYALTQSDDERMCAIARAAIEDREPPADPRIDGLRSGVRILLREAQRYPADPSTKDIQQAMGLIESVIKRIEARDTERKARITDLVNSHQQLQPAQDCERQSSGLVS